VTHEVFVLTYNQSVLYIVNGLTLALSTIPGFTGGPLGIGVNWVSNKAYTSFNVTTDWGIFDRNTHTLTYTQ